MNQIQNQSQKFEDGLPPKGYEGRSAGGFNSLADDTSGQRLENSNTILHKSAATLPQLDKAEFRQQMMIFRIAFGVILMGLCAQTAKEAGIIDPGFVPSHLANLADTAAVAAVLNLVQMHYSESKGKPIQSRPFLAAGVAFLLVSVWEVGAPLLGSGAQFDSIDELCYLASAAAYLLANMSFNSSDSTTSKP